MGTAALAAEGVVEVVAVAAEMVAAASAEALVEVVVVALVAAMEAVPAAMAMVVGLSTADFSDMWRAAGRAHVNPNLIPGSLCRRVAQLTVPVTNEASGSGGLSSVCDQPVPGPHPHPHSYLHPHLHPHSRYACGRTGGW